MNKPVGVHRRDVRRNTTSVDANLKEECLWQHNFANFPEARAVIGYWIRWHNERRPHQALGYLSPQQFRAQQLQALA